MIDSVINVFTPAAQFLGIPKKELGSERFSFIWMDGWMDVFDLLLNFQHIQQLNIVTVFLCLKLNLKKFFGKFIAAKEKGDI